MTASEAKFSKSSANPTDGAHDWSVRSNKCGAECRQSRKWQYESLEVEGVENRVKKNLHLVVKRP